MYKINYFTVIEMQSVFFFFLFSKSAHISSVFKTIRQFGKYCSVQMLLPQTSPLLPSMYYKLIRKLLTISAFKTYETVILIWKG